MAIIANIIVAAIIIIMIYGAISTLRGSSSTKEKEDCSNLCHDSDCSSCTK